MRLHIITLSYLSILIVIILRLFYWQVVKGEDLARQAQNQYEIGITTIAPRGNILARDGSWLVARDEAWLVYAELPRITKSTGEIADLLAPIFIDDELEDNERKIALLDEASRLKSLLMRDNVVWVPLKHKIDFLEKEKIESFDLNGIGFEQEEMRVYPEGSTAAHLLGFVGKNEHGSDVGYFGLEGFYDLVLSGKPGFIARESDARGIPILLGGGREVFSVDGVDLVTHVDKPVQLMLEKRFRKGIEKYGAVSGTGIIMDPKTGGIIAMVSYPSYSPKKYGEWSDEFFSNPGISNSFEPGSIFKVLVMAAGIDAGEVEPDTKCDICDGPLKVDKYYINTWDDKYRPDATMTDVIVHSDNVGMVFVAQKLGIDRMYDYLDKFGLGTVTGIDLQGESTPALRKLEDWSFVDLATSSFGQGIATTPLQITTAVSAIANDGILMRPQVVDKVIGNSGEKDIKPVEVERVLSKEASDKITGMMVEAASAGEAKWTYLDGFGVAGKTGTAQIPIEGHYDAEKTIVSFVGFAPFDDPKFVMLITLREPQSSPWASETAAPLWYDISKDLFAYYGIQPKN